MNDSYSSWKLFDIAGLFPNSGLDCYFVLIRIFLPGSRELERRSGERDFRFPIFNKP